MKIHLLKVTSCAVFLLSAMLVLGSCGNPCTKSDEACLIGELSEQYKKNHEYQSLVSLIPFLDLHDMTRADVERLLGEPAYCPALGQCYYLTDKMIVTPCSQNTQPDGDTCRNSSTGETIPPQRFPLILVVSYQGNGSMQPQATDPLYGFYLTPVGE
jgi:hypothetical protein